MTDDPVLLGGAAAGALLAVFVVVKLVKGGGEEAERRSLGKQANKALEAGDYETAALKAAQAGDLDTAFELYLRCQQPSKAAQIAQRQNKPHLAGELYEKAGDRVRAAAAYRQAGMTHKATELDPRHGFTADAAQGALDNHQQHQQQQRKHVSSAPPRVSSPQERAQKAEDDWREAAKGLKAGDKEAAARVEKYAEQAAEAWLSAGDIRRAADVSRQAGLVDQAVNLYVNVLGDPGSAAMVVAQRGDHKRAAELFEAAGQKERSLQQWMDWTKDAQDPLAHLNDVRRLGEQYSAKLLGAITAQRPLGADTLDLHYRVAVALANEKQGGQAFSVFRRIASVDPAYRDIGMRMTELQAFASEAPPAGGAGGTRTGMAPPAATKRSPEAMGTDDLDRVASHVANRAAEILRGEMARQSTPPPGIQQRAPSFHPPPMTALSPAHAPTFVHVKQQFDVTNNYNFNVAADANVREAKRGPSSAELRAMVEGKQASLSNIEVFYRLGLALLAGGQYEEAHGAFKTVENVSPGYRDASMRSQQLEHWSSVIAPKVLSEGNALAQRYTILGELGRGGMAVVYRARDEALGREVALKFLTEEAVGNEVMMQFFQREARAAGSLNHPNIVTIYDVGTMDGRAFICMELVDGVSLDTILERDKRLPLSDALRVTEHVLVALEYAHGKKIIHRDIKPANIMKTGSSLVKLMDFGLAKSVDGPKKSTVISGTPSYMSPEQLTGKDVDGRADLFAVGATLFELLTGEVPFHGMVRVDAPPSIRSSMPVAPTLLEQVVARSMEFDKAKRFNSATEMLAPIREILKGVGAQHRDAAPILVPTRGKGGTAIGMQPLPTAPDKQRPRIVPQLKATVLAEKPNDDEK